MSKGMHTQQEQYVITSRRLLEIEKLINEGQIEDAIIALNSADINATDVGEKEFLLGYANRINNNDRVAIQHFVKANSLGCTHLPAASEAISILLKHGYMREAKYFSNRISSDVNKEEFLSYADIESIGRLFENYDNQKTISIHQPAYIGWLGYFHKIYYADKFVIHDAVEFSKKSFIKRTLIRKNNLKESTYLVIPAKKGSDFSLISDMQADESVDWRTEHIRKIESTYRKAPYFHVIFPLIKSIFDDTRNMDSIVDITSGFTFGILEILNLKREIYFSSQLSMNENQSAGHEKNMEICEILGGAVYFSGQGARGYQDGKALPKNLNLVYQKIWTYLENNPYVEEPVFINGLSILDALFYIGPRQIVELFNKYEDPSNNLIFN
jgi:hypothetical protein